jgi:hypothetical protein
LNLRLIRKIRIIRKNPREAEEPEGIVEDHPIEEEDELGTD